MPSARRGSGSVSKWAKINSSPSWRRGEVFSDQAASDIEKTIAPARRAYRSSAHRLSALKFTAQRQ
jgi:hypothetical protein